MAEPKISQQVLEDFMATVAKNPNVDRQQLLQVFPEFGNDMKMLDAAFDYRATRLENPNADIATVNSKFPEFFGIPEPAQAQPATQPGVSGGSLLSEQEELARQNAIQGVTNDPNHPFVEGEQKQPNAFQTFYKGLGAGVINTANGLLGFLNRANSAQLANDPMTLQMMAKQGKSPEEIAQAADATRARLDSAETERYNAWKEKADQLAAEAKPDGGEKSFTDYIAEGEIGKALQLGLGIAAESLPYTASALNPVATASMIMSMSEQNYRQSLIDNPDMSDGQRLASAAGNAAIEMAVEHIGNPFKLFKAGKLTASTATKWIKQVVKESKDNIYKGILRVLGFGAKGAGIEGLEEVITTAGQDLYNTLLDWKDTNGLGLQSQWERMKEQNPDITPYEFAMYKAEGLTNDFIGGALSGMMMSGPSTGVGVARAAKYYSKNGGSEESRAQAQQQLAVLRQLATEFDVSQEEVAQAIVDYQAEKQLTPKQQALINRGEEIITNLQNAQSATQANELQEPVQETTPLSPAAAEHQRAVDEVTQSVRERTHSNGYIYPVAMPGNAEKTGYIVGEVVPVIDESNPEQLRIENDDIVTVKWSDGTVTQERARDLDLTGAPMIAQQAVDIEVENQMYAYTQQRIQNGEQPVLMRNGEGILEGFFPTEGGLLEDQNGVQYTPEQLVEQGWQETKPVLFVNDTQQIAALDNGDGTYTQVDALGNPIAEPMSAEAFREQGFAMVPLEEEQPKSQAPVEAPVVQQAPVEQTPEVQQPEVQEPAAPVVPNIETMSADELGGSAVEYMGDRASAMSYLEAERDKADAEVQRTSKLKVTRFNGPEDFKRQNDQIQAAKRAAIERYNKLQNAITAANAYKTLAEQKEEAERKAREAALREQRRQLAEAETAGDIEAKWQNTKKTVGFAATKTLPNGQKVNGHYILTEAGDVVPSHDPRKNYADSEGYVMENGQNVNDNNYKDPDVQRIALDIAQNYGGQAVEQMPFLENRAGRVLSGNNRTISGIIAAENNTDQAYLAALAENAQQYGFTPEQLAEYEHPRLQFVVEDELPFTTATFAMFNQQEKKTKSSVNRAVANSKMVTEAVRDKMLEIMDQYESLDSFFGSESAAADIVQALITEGLMTQQEVAGLTENTGSGFKFGQSGREYVTDMLLGTLFDEQTIKMLAGEKTLKQAILRALPSIVANRRLKGYELTDSINNAIKLLYEARKANEGKSTADAFQLYLRQVDAFEGSVMDRYNGFDIILANRMSAGVEQLREILGLYNNSAMNEANGQMGFFEPRTIDDIKQDVYEYYTNQQPELAAALNGAAARGAQPESAVSGGVADAPETRQPSAGEQALEAAAEAEQLQYSVPQRPNSKQLQGMNYTVAEAEDYIGRIVRNILDENGYEDVEIVGTKVIGSRVNGDAREDSDLDAIVEFKGDAREDSLFNLLHEDPIEIDGVTVDINPITEGKSGTIEQFMRRADEYLAEKEAAKAENPQENLQESEKSSTFALSNGQAVSKAEYQQKLSDYLDSIADEAHKPILFEDDTLIDTLISIGADESAVRQAYRVINNGGSIEGFYLNGRVCLNVDKLPNSDIGRSKYVHERQHELTRRDVRIVKEVMDAATEDELKSLLVIFSNSNLYDEFPHSVVADEFISFAMEEAYKASTDEELTKVLRDIGVKDELINIIKSINDEQRGNQSLSMARRTPYLSESTENSGAESRGNSETPSENGLVEERSGVNQSGLRRTKGGRSDISEGGAEQVTASDEWLNSELGKNYQELRKLYPQHIPVLRVGNEYHLYSDEAIVAGRVLGIEPTSRRGTSFISFPNKELEKALPELIRAGHRVVIVSDMEQPETAETPSDNRETSGTNADGEYRIGDVVRFYYQNPSSYGYSHQGEILSVDNGKYTIREWISKRKNEYRDYKDVLPIQIKKVLKSASTTQTETEIGGALVDRLGDMGVSVSTDLDANRAALKAAKADKSDAGAIHYYKTPSGQQYGFSYKGRIYLDPTKIDAELPIHEYGHLWAEAMRRISPESWRSVVDTIKADQASWDFVRELRPELTDENEIAEEVIATFSGKRGAERLRAEYKKMHGKDADYKSKWGNIFRNISKAIQDFWKAVGDFLNIKYQSAEQIYDQVLKDFVDNMNPYQKVRDFLRARDTEYIQAAESGDIQKATNIFYDALRENIGNGITPYMSVGTYLQFKRLAKGVKTRDAAIIREAAEKIAPLIPDNAVLVPTPSHTGRATDMLDLANAIAEITGSEVADILRSAPRESQYQAKKETGTPIASQQLGIMMEGTVPADKTAIVIDNVVDSGNTAEACIQALGKGVVVTLADSAEQYRHAASLRSAAPILRDKDGNIVPLTKRFNLNGSRYLGRRMYLRPNDPRFAISGTQVIPVGEKTLVGLHNISAEKLRKAIKMGGLANPSTAVINIASQNHEQYGDISLIMPSSLVDSKTGRNAGTFTGDIWSPTYPSVERIMSDKGDENYYQTITKLFANNEARQPILSRIKLDFDDYLDSGNIRAGLAYWYLLEKGIEPGDVYFNSGISDDIKERFRPLYDKGILDLTKEDYRTLLSLIAEQQGKTSEDMLQDAQESKERYQQTIDDPEAKQFYKKIAQQAIDEIDLYGVRYNVLSNGYHAMERAIRNDGKIDLDSTLIAAQDIVQTQHQADFDKWLSDMDKRFDIKEVLFEDYDRDGNRIYKPHTLANASRMMNKEDLQNAGDHSGLGATRGILVKRLETLADIRANKERLRPGAEEDFETDEWNKMQDEWFNKVLNPLSEMQKISDNPFSQVGYAETRLQEALRTKDPIATLNKEYGYKIDPNGEWAKNLRDMVQRVKDLPTKYFETKFRRPVYLDEFANAVVPVGLPQDLRDGLTGAGMTLFEYDPAEQGSRRAATLKATADEGIRFSISSAKGSPSVARRGNLQYSEGVLPSVAKEMESIKNNAINNGTFMQAPNGKPTNLDERQWLQVRLRSFKRWFGDWENDPQNASKVVDENGEPMVVYHGTWNNFTTFDKKKIYSTNFGKGFYFISDMQKALSYGHYLMPVFLNVRKPLDLTTGDNDAEYNKWYGKKKNPYDGYTFIPTTHGVNYTMVVVPNPNQIKSATDNDGSFSEENDDIRFAISNQNNDIFYSNAERAVEGIKQEKATPEQWRAMIEKAGGLKAGEDKWIGLSDWLAQQRPTVTPQANETRSQFVERAAAENKRFTLSKQDLLDYIREHKIQIEETEYGEASPETSPRFREFQNEVTEMWENVNRMQNGRFNEANQDIIRFEDDMQAKYGDDWRDLMDDSDRNVANYLQERRDEINMEVFLPEEVVMEEMCNRHGDDFQLAFSIDDDGSLSIASEDAADYYLDLDAKPINETRLTYTTQGLENKREIALTVPTIESWNESDEIHFGDAGEGRAIAWVRFGDAYAKGDATIEQQKLFKELSKKYNCPPYALREKASKEDIERLDAVEAKINEEYKTNGYGKVLVIDEIQSKRHQEGREKGYKAGDHYNAETLMSLQHDYNKSLEKWREVSFDALNKYNVKLVTDLQSVMPADEYAELDRVLRDTQDKYSAYYDYRTAYEAAKNDKRPVAAPFEKNWHELAMKRILRFAAENGYDKVAWTTGDQQAARYDIGKVVDLIEFSDWIPANEEENDYGVDYRKVVIRPRNQMDMWYYVDRNGNLINQDEGDPNTLAELVGKDLARNIVESSIGNQIGGEGLRIGGEGMRGFYDDILPRFMQKYGKKWGVQVGEVTMPQLEDGYQTMHSIDITDAMRESVLEGQPMFSISGRGVNGTMKPQEGETRSQYIARVAETVKNMTPRNTTIDDAIRFSITVNHNSPYLLKRADGAFIDPETGERLGFDHRFMGKGEGGQAHGWGSYFSVNDLRNYGEGYGFSLRDIRDAFNTSRWQSFGVGDAFDIAKGYLLEAHSEKAPSLRKWLEDRLAQKQELLKSYEGKVANTAEEDLMVFRAEADVQYIPALLRDMVNDIDTRNRHHYTVEIPDNDGTNYYEEDSGIISNEEADRIIKVLSEDPRTDEEINFAQYRKDKTREELISNIVNIRGNSRRAVYRNLSNVYGSDRIASELLRKAGFVGIHYDGHRDGECYVIFDENDAVITDHIRFSVTSGKSVLPKTPDASQVEHPMRSTYNTNGNIVGDDQIRFSVSGNYQSRNSIVTEALVKQANDSFRLMQSALRKVSADLRTINAIRTQQFEYDRKVVDMLLDLYNSLLQENSVWAGYMPDTTRRIATQIVHAIGKKDISAEVNTIMDHMVHAQAKAAQRQWDKLRTTPVDKINISGVVMQGKVALQGQHALKAMNEALDSKATIEQLEDQIAQLMDMEDNATDESLKLQYKGQWIGYTIAAQHLERIQHLVDERNQLDIELQAARSNRAIKPSARQQLVANIQQAMRDNYIAQADAYAQSAKDLAEYVTTQEEQAKDFIHRQDANRDKIRSYAQRDLEGLATNPNRDRTRGNIVRQIWDAFASPIRDLQSLLRLTGLHAPDGEGYLYNHFMRGWMDGADKERLGIVNASKTLDAKISELTHGKYKTWEEAARKINDASHNMFTITMLNGVDGKDMPVTEDIPLSAGNALYIYAVNKMNDGRMKLAGMNITEDDVKALTDKVREQFGQEILDVVDWVQSEYFSQLRNRYNPTHEALFGAPMDAIENYFPLRINAAARQQNEDLSEPDTDAARLLAGTSTGAIKRRTKNSLPLDVRNADFFQEVIRHIAQMERWNAFAQWNRDANILFSDINFRNRIKGMNGTIYGSGDQLYNYMKDAFRVAIGTYKPKTDTFSEITLNIAKGVTSAKINFRVWTAMKQIASFPAFFTYMTDGVFVGSYLRNWMTPHGTMKWARENLPNFEKRVSKRDMGDMRLMQRTTDWQWNKRVMEWSQKYGMAANVYFDTLTCATGARAVYDSRLAEYLKKGYPQEQAEQRARQDAEQAFNTSQQSSEGAFMSAVQMDRNLVTAALTVFRTSPIQYTRNFFYHTRNLLRKFGRGSKEEQIAFRMGQYKNDGLTDEQARKAAEKDYNKSIRSDIAGFVVYGALLNILWRLVGQVPYLLFGDDDDKKKQILDEATSGGAWFSPFTGLLGGGIVESALDGNGSVADMFAPELPFTQDVKRASQYLENNKYAEFANQALSVAMQSGTGFDPLTASDMIQRIVTTIDSEEELSAAEQALRISQAFLSIPQSQYEQQLVDRVVADESEYDAALADYIRYQKVHTAPLTWWLRGEESDEKAEENAEKRFDRLLNERDTLHNPEEE